MWRRTIASAAVVLVGGLLATGCARPGVPSTTPAPATGPVPVPSGRCQVRGQGSDPDQGLDRLRDACERALPVVTQVWPGWTGPALVIVAPTDLEPGTAAQVQGHARVGEPARADRVVVAPGLTERLSPEGLDLVLRHELTHLALRSTGTAPLPLWFSEGLASHVGYSAVADVRRERRLELARLRGRVESGDWTGTVPGPAAFDDPGDRPEAYTAAWLGVEVLLEQLGRERLVAAVRGPTPTSGAGLPVTDEERTRATLGSLGVSQAWFEERWRAELERRSS